MGAAERPAIANPQRLERNPQISRTTGPSCSIASRRPSQQQWRRLPTSRFQLTNIEPLRREFSLRTSYFLFVTLLKIKICTTSKKDSLSKKRERKKGSHSLFPHAASCSPPSIRRSGRSLYGRRDSGLDAEVRIALLFLFPKGKELYKQKNGRRKERKKKR